MHALIARRLVVSAVLSISMVALVPRAFAQNYPSRPVRIIVPFAPGGGADVVGRGLAQQLGMALHANFFVENRSGAGGVVGTELVARAAPDGYTLLLAPSSHVVNPAVMTRLPYDAEKSFEPISLVASATVLLAVNAKVPADDLKAYIKEAARPANLQLTNYGSSGNGTPFHLVSEQFKKSTGLALQHVPYRGGSPAAAALVAGDVAIEFETIVTLGPFVKSGGVRALAVTSEKRSPVFPTVPTIAELGYPELTFSNDYALYAPAGTPAAIIQVLAAEVKKALRAPELRDRLASQGTQAVGSTPEELRDYVHREIKRWKAVAQAANIKLD
jgi:tripartite-type tricarboxylate transporter receptor subunit TctC